MEGRLHRSQQPGGSVHVEAGLQGRHDEGTSGATGSQGVVQDHGQHFIVGRESGARGDQLESRGRVPIPGLQSRESEQAAREAWHHTSSGGEQLGRLSGSSPHIVRIVKIVRTFTF